MYTAHGVTEGFESPAGCHRCVSSFPPRRTVGCVSDTTDGIPEPVPARPWRPQDGPPPVVWTWPRSDPPALLVWSHGHWRRATVTAKQVWADGSVRYQVSVDLRGDTRVRMRTYQWPQPGLRVAHRSRSKPTAGVDTGRQGDMPQARPRQHVKGPRGA